MSISLVVGILAGFVAAVTAGAGVISIPALIFLGLSANEAIATNTMTIFGMLASALPRYNRAKKVRWDIGLKLIPLAIIGGFLGAKALVRVNADALSMVVGVLLLLLIPVVLLNPDRGVKDFKTSTNKILLGCIVFLAVMIYGGFLGAAAGIFAMYTFVFFWGMTYIEAKATVSVPSSFLSATALTIFIGHHLVNWRLGIPMTVGMYIGGAVGAKTALEKGNAWVRLIFIAMAVASAVKLLFFR